MNIEILEAVQGVVDMGGHGPYVWTVYLTAVVLLAANYVKLWRDRRQTLRTLREHNKAPGKDAR